MTDNLAAWLTQIWDEQEEAARFEKELTDGVYADSEFTVKYQWARMTRHVSGGYGSSFAKGAPSPGEVLARISADRQILALHGPEHDDIGSMILGPFCQICRYDEGLDKDPYPCATIRLLALPHVARPGYREEWRP